MLGTPDSPIEKADETALFQVINQLNPLVIVDESHHARSDLSLEMLDELQPLLCAGFDRHPEKARATSSPMWTRCQLKDGATSGQAARDRLQPGQPKAEVLIDTIDLRDKLEEIACGGISERRKVHPPHCPVPGPAEGQGGRDHFSKSCGTELVDAGIPAEHIAIRTADVNELKNVDLLSPDCPVRYIITVNALKEGWDCPFAYILASLANKTSQVDVEQILGRILRLPYTAERRAKSLNMSYVLTSSNDFNDTVQQIIRGTEQRRFQRQGLPASPSRWNQAEARTSTGAASDNPSRKPTQEDFARAGREIHRGRAATAQRRAKIRRRSARKRTVRSAEAQQAGDAYNQAVQGADNDPFAAALPWEVRDKVNTFPHHPSISGERGRPADPTVFPSDPAVPVYRWGYRCCWARNMLADGFTLKGKAYDIDFAAADDEIVKVDVRAN